MTTLGCRDSTGLRVCDLGAHPSVTVVVRDSLTGAGIASGATLVVRDGAFADSTSHPADDPRFDDISLSTPRSYERPGVYSLEVRRAGYADWTRHSVRVLQGECHVRSVTVIARMVPEP